MPRFHFHVLDAKNERDWVGTELADLTAARTEAVYFAAELLREDPSAFFDQASWSMRVTDHSDTTLLEMTFTAHQHQGTRTVKSVSGEEGEREQRLVRRG